ncbi:MAG: proline hydroxylase [Kordiimonadales bacterium]|nr:MAG: proline hydroxylase [Kordiimonadales bacterium]
MNRPAITATNHSTAFDEQTLEEIANAISKHGYIILPNVLRTDLFERLRQRAKAFTSSEWKAAGIGRNNAHHLDKQLRSDSIHWITDRHPSEVDFMALMESLRIGLNRRLFLGLFNFEAHFSKYPAGAFYVKHIDALKGRSNRVLSAVYYLNADWQLDDAGELLIYPETGKEPIERVLPKGGTLVLFESVRFPHEVLKANRTRFSIAGWFRVNENN